jgi:hypothetical protein
MLVPPAALFGDLSDIVNVEGRSTKGRTANPEFRVMSSTPLDIQRKCEQRWAARLARPVPPSAPHEHTDEKPDQQLAALGKAKKKNRRAKLVGLRPAPAV